MALLFFGRLERVTNPMERSMNAPQEQTRRPDVVKTPAWVREPQAPKTETKHAPPAHDEAQVEEPGYGHGV